MRSTFNDAAGNALGSNAPTYDRIKRGPTPTLEYVSSSRPIPHVILRGMAWQESHWLQFGNSVNDSDNTHACTLVSGDCGYGLMQMTSCMNDGCGWFAPGRVAGELVYNLGTGTNWLIKKWNAMSAIIGEKDHTFPEEWYYAVTAYNEWTSSNDPNRSNFYPNRPPYGEGNYSDFAYPYQEIVWGWMAHPEHALAGSHWLWRSTRIAAVPRGIFGLGVDWQPPSYPHKVFLPLALKNYVSNGYQAVQNGGFEEFADGKPRYWTVSSADAYPLADGTWFANGHYGAYLGGYDYAADVLRQDIHIPSNAVSANLTYAWYIRSWTLAFWARSDDFSRLQAEKSDGSRYYESTSCGKETIAYNL
jgi:hypothetical protein